MTFGLLWRPLAQVFTLRFSRLPYDVYRLLLDGVAEGLSMLIASLDQGIQCSAQILLAAA